jgi:hypothetical protein
MLGASWRVFEVIQEGGLMDGMNIVTVLVARWLPMSAVAKGRVGLKSVPGYGGVTFAKGLTDKGYAFWRFSTSDKSIITFRPDWSNIQYLQVLI